MHQLLFKLPNPFSGGYIPIYGYGVMIMIGFVTAVIIGLRKCQKFGIDVNAGLDLAITILVCGVAGARLFYFIQFHEKFDMALFKFTKGILEGKPIDVYNHGMMKRDFTYISDIVDGVVASLKQSYPYEIFNLGNSNTIELSYFIECIEKELGRKAQRNLMPMQPGDVPSTFADIKHSTEKLGFKPKVKIEQGIKEFIAWYKDYFKVDG